LGEGESPLCSDRVKKGGELQQKGGDPGDRARKRKKHEKPAIEKSEAYWRRGKVQAPYII